MTVIIRPYRDSDRAAVYDVCVETANTGQGVRGRYSNDDLVPDIFAGPYLYLEPQHAYVLDNGERAVGYIIGTADTPGYVAAYQERWVPLLLARYRPLSGPPVTEEEHRIDVMFHPERILLPELAAHPAHLHINVLAGYRGSGYGRELMNVFLSSVAAAGAASCHLMVGESNVNARSFYQRLGWQPVAVRDALPGACLLVHPAS